MGYMLDLRRISILKYLIILKNSTLLPGRMILLVNIDLKFHKICSAGISNLYELKNALSSPQKLSSFSAATGISENYLIILKREMGSLEQKPVFLSDFQGLAEDIIHRLSQMKIKTSKDFFDLYNTYGNIDMADQETGISEGDINELYCLCNLVRINGIGPSAARTIYESGYKRIEDVAAANAKEMLDRITEVNTAKQYYLAKLGVKDMQFTIDSANLILVVSE